MGRKTEPLSGGLVTDRDAALLKPGQLSDIRNLVYKNGAAMLERAPGRIVFASASSVATGVVGLRDITFDTGNNYLVAHAGNKLLFSSATGSAVSGLFTELATVTAGTSLEVVHYRNRFFLMNGASSVATAIGSNVVVYMTATAAGGPVTTRQHGMLPVISAPTTAATAVGGFSQTVTGYYEYWTTEVAEITQDAAVLKLESAFSSENGPTTVYVTSTAVGGSPLIQRPIVRNASATLWRIYRSPKKDKYTDKKFPSGFMIFEGATSTTGHIDTLATASASSLPTLENAAGFGLFYGDFASASSMRTDNNVYASATSGGSVVEVQQGVYGFTTLNTVAGQIKGIAVEIKGYCNVGAPVTVQATIGIRNAFNGSFKGGFGPLGWQKVASKSAVITAAAASQTITLGDATDRWFPTNFVGLSDVDVTTANSLMLRLSFSKINATIGIDYVKVFIYYGASVDGTVQYPTVVYNFGDITAQVSKNMPPPSSNTGDLFQDSLVVNDVSAPSILRWSAPGDPEAFPPTYFMDFETRENDIIRAVRVVNNRLVVGLDSSLWRMNYLPSERDASFDRGKCAEIISRSQGIVNPMCCCTFTMEGGSEQLAFISNKGLCTTDGFNFVTRSKNLTWRNHISVAAGVTSTPVALLNDPENRCLRFYYQNTSDTSSPELCLWASYDAGDIDAEGNFKFSGPVNMENWDQPSDARASVKSAWAVPRPNGSTNIYIGYGGMDVAPGAGKVYVESGTTIPSFDSTCQYTTRRIYAAGLSAEWMLDDLYGYCGTYSGSPQIIYTFKGTKTNDAGETTRGTKSLTLQGGPLHHVTPKIQVEGLRINMQATATTFQQEMLVLGSTVYGAEDSGRSA